MIQGEPLMPGGATRLPPLSKQLRPGREPRADDRELGAHLPVSEAAPNCPVSNRTAPGDWRPPSTGTAAHAQRGDLAHSPLGGHPPGTVLPPRDLPGPLHLQPLQTLGPSRGPRSKAQTSPRQTPLLTRFPGTSNRCPFCPIQQIPRCSGRLPANQSARLHLHNGARVAVHTEGQSTAKLESRPTQAALDAPEPATWREGRSPWVSPLCWWWELCPPQLGKG